jgi:2'-5' RNA ligase
MKCDEILRLFIAVEISDEVRQNLAAMHSEITRTRANVKCVSPSNLHVTMVFIGDVFGGTVEGVCAVMDESLQGTDPFHCEVRGIGFFGSRRSPRVIWAGLAGDIEPLTCIHRRLVSGLAALDLSLDEREFHPHITLARVRSSKNARDLAPVAEANLEKSFGSIEVGKVTLMRSELQPQGPVYTVVHRTLQQAGRGGYCP